MLCLVSKNVLKPDHKYRNRNKPHLSQILYYHYNCIKCCRSSILFVIVLLQCLLVRILVHLLNSPHATARTHYLIITLSSYVGQSLIFYWLFLKTIYNTVQNSWNTPHFFLFCLQGPRHFLSFWKVVLSTSSSAFWTFSLDIGYFSTHFHSRLCRWAFLEECFCCCLLNH